MSVELGELEKRVKEAEKKNLDLTSQVTKLETEKATLLNMPQVVTRSENSDEKRLLRSFGAQSVRDLLTTNVCDPSFKGVSEDLKMQVINLKKHIDLARWTQQLCYGEALDHDGDEDKAVRVRGSLENAYAKKYDLQGRLKAFGTEVVEGGAEWVQTIISSQFIPEYELANRVVGAIREIPMPSSPYSLRVKKGLGVARIIGEGAQMTAGGFQTATIDMKAVKLAEYYEVPEEVQEDTVGDFLALAREEVVEAHLRAYDHWLISGDTTALHMDSDVVAADDARKAGKGWRRLALDNTANGGTYNITGTLSDAKIVAMRSQMGKFGVNPSELMWVVSPVGYQKLQALEQVVTVDKAGMNTATVLRGILDSYRGIPIYVSEAMRDDLNLTGVHDGVTETATGIILGNHRRFFFGRRRPIRAMITRDLPYYDRWLLAAYSRQDIKGHAQSADETSLVYGYNLLV